MSEPSVFAVSIVRTCILVAICCAKYTQRHSFIYFKVEYVCLCTGSILYCCVVVVISPCGIPCRELVSGSLSTNGIENGSEIRLVPAIESGVTVSKLSKYASDMQCVKSRLRNFSEMLAGCVDSHVHIQSCTCMSTVCTNVCDMHLFYSDLCVLAV